MVSFVCSLLLSIENHKHYGQGKHRDETCTNPRRKSTVFVKFLICNGPAWEVTPSALIPRRGFCPTVGRISTQHVYPRMKSRAVILNPTPHRIHGDSIFWINIFQILITDLKSLCIVYVYIFSSTCPQFRCRLSNISRRWDVLKIISQASSRTSVLLNSFHDHSSVK